MSMEMLAIHLADGDERAWMDMAACRTVPNPDIFFPEPGAPGRRLVQLAKATCARCPVIDRCGTYVREVGLAREAGIWAGQTETERRESRQAVAA